MPGGFVFKTFQDGIYFFSIRNESIDTSSGTSTAGRGTTTLGRQTTKNESIRDSDTDNKSIENHNWSIRLKFFSFETETIREKDVKRITIPANMTILSLQFMSMTVNPFYYQRVDDYLQKTQVMLLMM
jgi:hypothetical protein